jgi:hypothetical protein
MLNPLNQSFTCVFSGDGTMRQATSFLVVLTLSFVCSEQGLPAQTAGTVKRSEQSDLRLVETAMAMLSSRNPEYRMRGAQFLATVSGKAGAAAPGLLKVLQNSREEPRVLAAAIRALGAIGKEASADLLPKERKKQRATGLPPVRQLQDPGAEYEAFDPDPGYLARAGYTQRELKVVLYVRRQIEAFECHRDKEVRAAAKAACQQLDPRPALIKAQAR